MPLPNWLEGVLSADAARTWETITPLVPQAAYLAGDTAIAVHLRHRVSRDLDFFYHENAVDLDELTAALEQRRSFAIVQRSPGTLNGLSSETRVEFLHADEGQPQRLLVRPSVVEGIRVAGLADLIAMKLKVIAERGELRDYFDLQRIEQQTDETVDAGLGYFLARYAPRDPRERVMAIIRALGYLEDVDEDELLPSSKAAVASYWARRQPQILKAAGWLTSGGDPPPSRGADAVDRSSEGVWVGPHTRRGREARGRRGRRS